LCSKSSKVNMSILFLSFHHFKFLVLLLALPTKARILCLDSL
jgi:hypothetical protein